jgi:ABC-type branched-subunit amino acid transport system substrate-binding protein
VLGYKIDVVGQDDESDDDVAVAVAQAIAADVSPASACWASSAT